MNFTNKYYFPILIILFLISCNNAREKSFKNNKSAIKIEKTKKNDKIDSLNLIYNVKSDKLFDYKYSYEFQEKYIESKNFLGFEGQIIDISKKDSLYFVKIQLNKTALNNLIALISIEKSKFNNLEEKLSQSKYKKTNGYFISRINDFKIISPSGQAKNRS